MLRIRREQLEAFSREAVSSFEDRMVAHLREVFPDVVRGLDEAAVRARIQDGIQRAAAYDIVSERGVSAYVDVMFLHGDGFDTDRRRRWAAAILHDRSIRSPVERADRLLRAALADAGRSPTVGPRAHDPGARADAPPGRAAPPPPAARRAIVEVRWGPLAYRKAILDPGRTLRVGRSSDLALSHDARLSATHFSLAWDGERCVVRDLDGAGGTWLNGERVVDAEVPNGAWIRAGESHVMVYIEAFSAPDAAGPAPAAEAERALHELSRARPLFAVVDASRGPRPLRVLREAVDEHQSLYEGAKGEALDHCAPYLVALRPDSALLDRLVFEGWGAGWGIFFTSAQPLRDVRRHLRRFLLVEDDETGARYYFRFYDPRTLRAFVPACTPRQRVDFFGEIGCLFAEGARGELCRFTREDAP